MSKSNRNPYSLFYKLFFAENPIVLALVSLIYRVYDCETLPSLEKLTALTVSFMVLNACSTVRQSFFHCTIDFSPKSLNSYYWLFDYSKIDFKNWSDNIVRIILSLLPSESKNRIVFLSIDDTILEKFGKKFEHIRILFDHSSHDSNKYKNAHCFVALMLSIPVKIGFKFFIISIPVQLRMWVKDEKTKHEIAAEMVEHVSALIGPETKKVLLCDSWYPKGAIINLVGTIENFSITANVRVDTALYDIPEKKEGRGRPRKYGNKLDHVRDFPLREIAGTRFLIGYRPVKTRIFGGDRTVMAFVTKPVNGGSHRLFVCSDPSIYKDFDLDLLPDNEAKTYAAADRSLIAYCVYKYRWSIEVIFQELKVYWNLGGYRLRSRVGIERLTNLVAVVYALLEMLPYLDPSFACLEKRSHQERRFLLGRLLDRHQILCRFLKARQGNEKSVPLEELLAVNKLEDPRIPEKAVK